MDIKGINIRILYSLTKMASRAVVNNPCTLIYNLLDGAPITLRQLQLILRSLHTFEVKDIAAQDSGQRVVVELNYQANVSNCVRKLGPQLAAWVRCRKLKGDIQREELDELEQLQTMFNFGNNAEDESGSSQRSTKKRKYVHSNKTDPQV